MYDVSQVNAANDMKIFARYVRAVNTDNNAPIRVAGVSTNFQKDWGRFGAKFEFLGMKATDAPSCSTFCHDSPTRLL